MKPIDPAEISGLLDGELSPARADEVRQAIAENAALRQLHDTLVSLDLEWKAAAATAEFHPHTAPSGDREYLRVKSVAVVAGLLVLRLVIKAATPGIGFLIELALLAALFGWGLRWLLEASAIHQLGGVRGICVKSAPTQP
jgi:anti-sigma factor RsiW